MQPLKTSKQPKTKKKIKQIAWFLIFETVNLLLSIFISYGVLKNFPQFNPLAAMIATEIFVHAAVGFNEIKYQKRPQMAGGEL